MAISHSAFCGPRVVRAPRAGREMLFNKNGTLASYGNNAFGERVIKTVSGSSKQFVYDEDGHLLGEYDAANLVSEYVWLGDVSVAVIKPSASTQGGIIAGTAKVYLIEPDHLDTPRVIVNAANQVVWRWDSAPFGDTNANEQPTASLASFQFNLRFPGQQFDVETGSHYNHSRDYDSQIGRYLQSDSLGLEGGTNTYIYAYGAPSHYSDRYGRIPDWRAGLRNLFVLFQLVTAEAAYKKPTKKPCEEEPKSASYDPGGTPGPGTPPRSGGPE